MIMALSASDNALGEVLLDRQILTLPQLDEQLPAVGEVA